MTTFNTSEWWSCALILSQFLWTVFGAVKPFTDNMKCMWCSFVFSLFGAYFHTTVWGDVKMSSPAFSPLPPSLSPSQLLCHRPSAQLCGLLCNCCCTTHRPRIAPVASRPVVSVSGFSTTQHQLWVMAFVFLFYPHYSGKCTNHLDFSVCIVQSHVNSHGRVNNSRNIVAIFHSLAPWWQLRQLSRSGIWANLALSLGFLIWQIIEAAA